MLKIVSLYSGADGLGEGCFQAGHKIILAIDIEKDCLETIKLNHPDVETICGKVQDYIESLPDCDAIVGGPPCPEFSNAKINKTYDPTEVNNFWKSVELKKPKHYFMENVPGVIRVCKRRNHLVNAADYGTPQTRIRRIFTDLPFPIQTHNEFEYQTLFGDKIPKWVSVREALGVDGILQDRKSTFGEGFRNYSIDNPGFTLLSDSRVFILRSGFDTQNGREITRSIDEPSQTIMCGDGMKLTNHRIFSKKYLETKNDVYYKKHPANDINKPILTILGKDRGTEGYIHDGKYARKLTNDEIAILQGFPKNYKFFGNKTSVRSQIGNAVPPQVSKAFFSQVT